MSFIYVFHGDGARFAAAVYSSAEEAKSEIASKRLSGMLTAYPLDQTVYDYVVDAGVFAGKEDPEPRYIQRFTSASMEHYHFEDGVQK